MTFPVLTPEEIQILTSEAEKQTSYANAIAAQVTNKQDRIDELTILDGSFQKFFNYYDGIIRAYNAERRSISGIVQNNPITEADILAIQNGGRLAPTYPVTDIVRVSEFDGGNTSSTDANEQKVISDINLVSSYLRTGNSGSTFSAALGSTIDGTLTNLTLSSTIAINLSIGQTLIIGDSTSLAIVTIDSIVDESGMSPSFSGEYEISYNVLPENPITAGTATFNTGFSDIERTSETASNFGQQVSLESLKAGLLFLLSNQKLRLSEQTTALNSNDDPDGTTQISNSLTGISNMESSIDSFVANDSISDSALNSLDNDLLNRSNDLLNRLLEISNNYTNQTENYYDRRYAISNDRGNTIRGTLRLKQAAEDVLTNIGVYKTVAEDSATAFLSLIP